MRHRLARGAWPCGASLGRPTSLGMVLGAIVTLAAQQLLGYNNVGMPTYLRRANGRVGGRLSLSRDLGDRAERVSRLDQPHAAVLAGEDTGTLDQNDRLLAEVAQGPTPCPYPPLLPLLAAPPTLRLTTMPTLCTVRPAHCITFSRLCGCTSFHWQPQPLACRAPRLQFVRRAARDDLSVSDAPRPNLTYCYRSWCTLAFWQLRSQDGSCWSCPITESTPPTLSARHAPENLVPIKFRP